MVGSGMACSCLALAIERHRGPLCPPAPAGRSPAVLARGHSGSVRSAGAGRVVISGLAAIRRRLPTRGPCGGRYVIVVRRTRLLSRPTPLAVIRFAGRSSPGSARHPLTSRGGRVRTTRFNVAKAHRRPPATVSPPRTQAGEELGVPRH